MKKILCSLAFMAFVSSVAYADGLTKMPGERAHNGRMVLNSEAIANTLSVSTISPFTATTASGSGGPISISAGAGAGTNKAGGAVTIAAGAATGTGAIGTVILTTPQAEIGGAAYPTTAYPSGTNTYLVMDKGGTAADSSVVLRDQGAARAEVGVIGDNNLHFKVATGSYGAETLTDMLILNNDASTADFYSNVRLNRATGTPTLYVGNNNGSTGAGLELEYDQTNTQADITSIERGNQYRALLLQSAGVQFWLGTSSTTHLADIEVAGDYKGPGVISTGTKFTLSGCSAGTTVGGATAGKFTSGTSGTCTVVITLNGATGLTSPTGWSCWANDQTTPADKIQNTSSTTTTATISGTTISGDVINFGCVGY